MKMSAKRYENIKNTVRAIVDHTGPHKVREFAEKHSLTRLCWELYNAATIQLLYDDNHPHFVSGRWTRITPHQPGFDSYDDHGNSLNDNHIETAMKRIVKELGLVSDTR